MAVHIHYTVFWVRHRIEVVKITHVSEELADKGSNISCGMKWTGYHSKSPRATDLFNHALWSSGFLETIHKSR